jgi:hypothetical protein
MNPILHALSMAFDELHVDPQYHLPRHRRGSALALLHDQENGHASDDE